MTAADHPAPARDLAVLLRGLRPQLRDGEWVFVTAPRLPDGVQPLASFAEDEGLSLVVRREQADAAGLASDFVAAWITLSVHSALDAVGLTAAVAAQLARAGISCNVIAARSHDHLFVPHDRARSPSPTSNSTAWPSRSNLVPPSPTTTEACTNRSVLPSSGARNPKPRSGSNQRTVL